MAEMFLKVLSAMLLLFPVSHPTGLFFRGTMDLKCKVPKISHLLQSTGAG